MATEDDNNLSRQMFSSFSHDLKTPLASIIGSLEVLNMMKDRLAPEKRAILIETSLQESHRLDRYISNILELSKLELGLVKTHIEEINLKDALNEAILAIKRERKQPDIEIICADNGTIVTSDLKLLARIMNIIIENSVIHSVINPDDNAKIEIWCEHKNGITTLVIRDYGIGIPIENQSEIFEKYARIKHQDRRNSGTGLGLSIAREIGKLLNIELRAGNHPKGGALIEIIFNL